jgi:exodeoxyribonuclease VII large subunit
LVRLSALIAQAASAIGRIAVEGEIHRVQRGKTGRLWFTLRDRAAQVSVSVPASRQSRCRVVAGERVSVVGRLEWVNDWGQLQLLAEEITPVGEGAIAAAIAEARRSLAADGLLDRPRRPIPMLPAAIGVVCGHEAAVRADIESVVAARFAGYPMVFWETTVSGPGAVDNVIAALAELDKRTDVEVIILARGGGDATQLLPFSDEQLCRAVCATTTPVVAAIGHDGDRPLVDEVADLRCGTPSLAAGAVVPDRLALGLSLDRLLALTAEAMKVRLGEAERTLAAIDRAAAARRGLDGAARHLLQARHRLELVHPARELDRATARLDRLDWVTPAVTRLREATRHLDGLHRQGDALSPARVLERGYAVVRQADGSVVRVAASVAAGAAVDIEVADGRFRARAEARSGELSDGPS